MHMCILSHALTCMYACTQTCMHTLMHLYECAQHKHTRMLFTLTLAYSLAKRVDSWLFSHSFSTIQLAQTHFSIASQLAVTFGGWLASTIIWLLTAANHG